MANHQKSLAYRVSMDRMKRKVARRPGAQSKAAAPPPKKVASSKKGDSVVGGKGGGAGSIGTTTTQRTINRPTGNHSNRVSKLANNPLSKLSSGASRSRFALGSTVSDLL